MNSESIRFEDVLTQLEAQAPGAWRRSKETVDRLLRQREEDARKAREFREQMERAKENARSQGRGGGPADPAGRPAPPPIRCSRSSRRCARPQAKADRALNDNEARAQLRRRLNEAEDAVSRRDARAGAHPQAQPPHSEGRSGGAARRPHAGGGDVGRGRRHAAAQGRHPEDDGEGLGRCGSSRTDERRAKAPKTSISRALGPDLADRGRLPRSWTSGAWRPWRPRAWWSSFIDSAVMGRLETVTIIHGKGTGALRKAVHQVLRRNKAVKSYPPGRLRRGRGGRHRGEALK